MPVICARMRKERDWEVPVRGCQSSVSSIRRFLLASLRGETLFSGSTPAFLFSKKETNWFQMRKETGFEWLYRTHVLNCSPPGVLQLLDTFMHQYPRNTLLGWQQVFVELESMGRHFSPLIEVCLTWNKSKSCRT